MAAKKYEWADGTRMPGNAEVVGRELDRIRKRDGLTAGSVLAEARKRNSVLHQYFEWDDTEAAKQHRLSQARELIRKVVRIDMSDELPPVRAFIKLSDEVEYEPVRDILSDQEKRVRLLSDVRVNLKSMKEKLSNYSDYIDLVNALTNAEKAAAQQIVVAKRKTSRRPAKRT